MLPPRHSLGYPLFLFILFENLQAWRGVIVAFSRRIRRETRSPILFPTAPIILSLSWGMCEDDTSLMNTQETFSGLAQQKNLEVLTQSACASERASFHKRERILD
jgi:hypothetical protein